MRGACGDIRNHPWFSNFDFRQLMAFQIKPSFIPNDNYLDTCCTSFNELTETELRETLIDPRHTYKPWIDSF